MFTPPTTLRKSGLPRESFSHHKLLEICRYYKNLLYMAKQIQAEINEAIDEFQHSQSGRPTPYTERLITRLASIDAGVRGPLLEEIMQVELAIIKWEGKSSKLRAEADRQRRVRARKRHRGDGDDGEYNYTAPGTDPFADDEATQDPNDFASVTAATPPLPDGPTISPTMALAQRGMSQLPQVEPGEAPDTSNYRKSGLV